MVNIHSRIDKSDALFDESEIEHFGQQMFQLCQELWPLNRSLSGQGNRQTLSVLRREFPAMSVHEIPSGTTAFDWEVPLEWNITEAWIKTPDGRKICDFSTNNLHVVGYSVAAHEKIPLADLQQHLYSLPAQPGAIPYVTSYYNPTWGFCISDDERNQLTDGLYEVFIDSSHTQGHMTYGELLVPGSGPTEVLLSTYICHPSMANNELSGIALALQLAKWLSTISDLKHSYRIVFLPETIGAITYLSEHLEELRDRVIAGYVLTCVGDERNYSYVPSRRGDTLADRVARHVLRNLDPDFCQFTWTDRQSDERQYCAPHVNLPVGSMMRTKYGAYPEYHTSLDTLGTVVTPNGLAGAMRAYIRAIQVLELDFAPVSTTVGEPQLGKRNLYPPISMKEVYSSTKNLRDVLSLSDGEMTLMQIADCLGIDFKQASDIATTLVGHGLLKDASTAAMSSVTLG